MPETEKLHPMALSRLREFLDELPSAFDAQSFSLEDVSVADIEVLERLVTLEQTLQQTNSQLELAREDALVSRQVLRQDAEARLKLLGRITWMAAGVVSVNLLLLGLVVGAAVYKQYQPDQWFLRILASGPPVAIVGMLSAIASHYWPRKTAARTNKPKK